AFPPRLVPRLFKPPFSLSSILRLSSDLRTGLNSSSFADVILVSCDGHVIFAHQAILIPRWKWLREHSKVEWVLQRMQTKKTTCLLTLPEKTKVDPTLIQSASFSSFSSSSSSSSPLPS